MLSTNDIYIISDDPLN